jgi:hypothetical protein
MEPLLDPEGDRAMKEIVPPPHRPISEELLYPTKGKPPLCLLDFRILDPELGSFEDAYVQRGTSVEGTLPENTQRHACLDQY